VRSVLANFAVDFVSSEGEDYRLLSPVAYRLIGGISPEMNMLMYLLTFRLRSPELSAQLPQIRICHTLRNNTKICLPFSISQLPTSMTMS
jgi:hypothetical protein